MGQHVRFGRLAEHRPVRLDSPEEGPTGGFCCRKLTFLHAQNVGT